MLLWWSFFLGVLEKEETPQDEKEKALEALLEVLYETEAEFAGPTTIRISFLTDSYAREFCSANQGIARLLLYSMYLHNPKSSVISRMTESEFIFPWIFDGIGSDDDNEHKIFVDILDTFARYSEKEDMDTVVIRYFNSLRNAICAVFTRDLISIDIIDGFLSVETTLAMVAVMPSILCRWALTTKIRYERQKLDVCRIILRVLETSLESPLTLQNLLGTGILTIANNFSIIRDLYDFREEADVFRRILEKHPEFRQQFREWTVNGAMGNMVAELGRSIPPKVLTGGTDYIFYEEDKAI